MKRITIFSTLTVSNRQTILEQIFPANIAHKVVAYMPSGGVEGAKEYIDQWENIAREYGAKFIVINNKLKNVEEQRKLDTANILIISGGNTFDLLYSLRQSGLDQSIKQFIDKSEFVLAGFSAGALVLTPSVEICKLPALDENRIGLKDLTGLGIVNFEIFPHYDRQFHESILNNYRENTSNPVREITDEDYISIDL